MSKSGKRPVRIEWDRHCDRPSTSARLGESEVYGPVDSERYGQLFTGNNLDLMSIMAGEWRGMLDLIYIDPPYGTGKIFRNREFGGRQSEAFDDRWDDGLAGYLDMMAPRLAAMRDLLCARGSIYVHTDWHAAHYIKLLLDEIFGEECFQNEIVWCYREAINSKKRWNRKHDLIFMYSRGKDFYFDPSPALEPHSPETVKKYRNRDEKGPYRLMGRGLKGSPVRSARDISPRWEIEHPELTYRHYLPAGKLPVDYWNIDIINQASSERTGYATQKPLALLDRIVRASSPEGGIVADFFCGSGTTAMAASAAGRNWIACDISPQAVEIAKDRITGWFPHYSLSTTEIIS